MRLAHLTLLGLVMAAGCDGSDTVPTDPNEPLSEIPTDATLVPDPGEGIAPLSWFDDGGYHGTPDTAQAMGVVTTIPDYVQGGIDPITGVYFYAFRTGPNRTRFSVNLFDRSSAIETVHIHEGFNYVFGDEVPPSVILSPTQVEWDTLNPDSIYILEIASPMGGFF